LNDPVGIVPQDQVCVGPKEARERLYVGQVREALWVPLKAKEVSAQGHVLPSEPFTYVVTQVLEGLAAEIREQNAVTKALAEACRNSSSDIAALKSLAEKEVEAIGTLAKIVEQVAERLERGQAEAASSIGAKVVEATEAVRKLDEALRRLIATI